MAITERTELATRAMLAEIDVGDNFIENVDRLTQIQATPLIQAADATDGASLRLLLTANKLALSQIQNGFRSPYVVPQVLDFTPDQFDPNLGLVLPWFVNIQNGTFPTSPSIEVGNSSPENNAGSSRLRIPFINPTQTGQDHGIIIGNLDSLAPPFNPNGVGFTGGARVKTWVSINSAVQTFYRIPVIVFAGAEAFLAFLTLDTRVGAAVEVGISVFRFGGTPTPPLFNGVLVGANLASTLGIALEVFDDGGQTRVKVLANLNDGNGWSEEHNAIDPTASSVVDVTLSGLVQTFDEEDGVAAKYIDFHYITIESLT